MSSSVRLPKLPMWLALVVAGIAGLVNSCAFPGLAWWPLSFVALFLLWWSLHKRSVLSGLLVGFVFGLTMWLALISWLTLYLGPVPWIALAVTESLYIAAATAAIVFVQSATTFVSRSLPIRRMLTGIGVASIWLTHEFVASSWPWGGFSWGRSGMSLAGSPLATAASWIGISGLSFFIAWFSYSLFSYVSSSGKLNITNLAAPIVVLLILIFIPLFPTHTVGVMHVSGIQANTKSGLFDDVQPGENLQKNIDTTLKFATPPVDLVIWPENSADIDPLSSMLSLASIEYLSHQYDAPFLVGAITHPTETEYFNSSLLIDSHGVTAQYDKVHPVPFAEYMPARDFFHALAPELVDMVWRDYSFGTRSNVMQTPAGMIGVAICFDIVDDQLLYNMVANGATVIVAQTNNADFGDSVEHVQQLAITRLRAIETGRYVVNVSTVGTTAVIAPDGTISSELEPHTEGALNATVRLNDSTPPGLVIGRVFDIAAAAYTVALIISAALSRLIPRRRVAADNS